MYGGSLIDLKDMHVQKWLLLCRKKTSANFKIYFSQNTDLYNNTIIQHLKFKNKFNIWRVIRQFCDCVASHFSEAVSVSHNSQTVAVCIYQIKKHQENIVDEPWFSAFRVWFDQPRLTMVKHRPVARNVVWRGFECRRLSNRGADKGGEGRGIPPPNDRGWGLERGPPPHKKWHFLLWNGAFWCILEDV